MRKRPGRCATLAAVRANTFGRIAGGVPLLAAVRRTLLAIFGRARIAFGPPLATRVLAAVVAALAACLRWVGDIEAPRSLTIERAASPATTGSARRSWTAISATASSASSTDPVPVHGFETPICAYAAMGIGAS